MLSLATSPNPEPVPEQFNLAEYVLAGSGAAGSKTALEVLGDDGIVESLSYLDLRRAVRGTATGLYELGLTAGDRVLLQLGNTSAFPIAFLGAIGAGMIPVIVSPQLTAREIAAVTRQIGPKLSLVGSCKAAAPCPTLNLALVNRLRDLAPAQFTNGDPDRPAYIIYTSGTSGQPMPVVHAHRAVWARRMMWDGWYGLKSNDRVLHAGAFNWSFTLGTGLLDPWARGATALIPQDGTTMTDLPAMLATHQATLFAAAPGILRKMMRAEMPPLPKLRHALTAGEALSRREHDNWTRITAKPVYQAFGMSECSTFISGSPDNPAIPPAIGYAQTGRTIAIVEGNDVVPRGTVGQLAVHKDDPGLMLGYLDDSEATQARFCGDWFLTGDMAQMAEDGAVTYVGRVDDMMNAGGVRVSPIEVETVLASHPQISDCAVAAVQVRTGVSVIAAFYVAQDVIDETELADFCATRLAAYKLPRVFVAKSDLPRNANNKLLRGVLRTEWETAHGQA